MRASAQVLGAVGVAPGLAMSVPWPTRRFTVWPPPVTETSPWATNTPNTLLLGPAKNVVPRTAIRPNGERMLQVFLFGVVVAVEHEWALFEIERATGIDDVLVDAEPGERAKLYDRGLAEMHDEAGAGVGLDQVAGEDIGGRLQVAAWACALGEGLAAQ